MTKENRKNMNLQQKRWKSQLFTYLMERTGEKKKQINRKFDLVI